MKRVVEITLEQHLDSTGVIVERSGYGGRVTLMGVADSLVRFGSENCSECQGMGWLEAAGETVEKLDLVKVRCRPRGVKVANQHCAGY